MSEPRVTVSSSSSPGPAQHYIGPRVDLLHAEIKKLRAALADAQTGFAFVRDAIRQQNYGTAAEYCEQHDKDISKVLD